MDALRAAGASLQPRLSEFRAGGPRTIIGAFLEHLHGQLHAFWDAVPAADRAAAEAASVRALPPGDAPTSPMPGPYWRWVPILQGYALPAPAPPLAFASPCFAVNTATGVFSPDGATYTVTLASSLPANGSCADSYLLGTVDYLHVATHSASAGAALNTSLAFPVDLARKASPLWAARNGALVLRFIDPEPLTIIYEALATVGAFAERRAPTDWPPL
jgi:hypothetical protein